uniref:Uncharacterized protein n=1 Tax=Setaria viridis TaxID=4556 RepID=A0A4U6TN36_SETVI|nr:hypothetical protein SEVIR_8G213800v2 [Setaria viridis]
MAAASGTGTTAGGGSSVRSFLRRVNKAFRHCRDKTPTLVHAHGRLPQDLKFIA